MTGKIYADLIKALAVIDNPGKDGSNPHFESSYATLEGCLGAVKKALSDNNLALTQQIRPDPDRLVTRLIHTSGEFIEDGGVPLKPRDPTNPQSLMSAITYARRYGLMAMLGITGEDDDGNAATKPPPPSEMKPPEPKPAPAIPAKTPAVKPLPDHTKDFITKSTETIAAASSDQDLTAWTHDNMDALTDLERSHPEQVELLRKEYGNKQKEMEKNA